MNCSLSPLHEGEASKAAAAALAESGLNPDRLSIEVTERTIADDRAAADLRAISALGVHLAVDDVGTSWSSLQPLERLNVEIVKVDQPFVNSLEADGGMNRAIVEAIIHVAHSLNMTTVAEGIETARQVNILKEFGADVGQGYFFAHPLSADATADLASTKPRLVVALGPVRTASHLTSVAEVADEDAYDEDDEETGDDVEDELKPNPFADPPPEAGSHRAHRRRRADPVHEPARTRTVLPRTGPTGPEASAAPANDAVDQAPMPAYLRRRGGPVRHKPQSPMGTGLSRRRAGRLAGGVRHVVLGGGRVATIALTGASPAPVPAPAPAPAVVSRGRRAPGAGIGPGPASGSSRHGRRSRAGVAPAPAPETDEAPLVVNTASVWIDNLVGDLLGAAQSNGVDIVADSREVVQAVAEAFDRSA